MLPEPSRKADALKRSVVRPLDDAVVRQSIKHFLGNFFAGRKVNHLNRRFIYRISEKKYFKVRRFAVAIYATFCQINIGICFQIQRQVLYFTHR